MSLAGDGWLFIQGTMSRKVPVSTLLLGETYSD